MQVLYNPKCQTNEQQIFCSHHILSDDVSLNPEPVYNNKSLDTNDCNVFKLKAIHLTHLNVNNLLPGTAVIGYRAVCTNAVLNAITES